MKTYYAYTRVSTVKQGEKGSSLQEQKGAILAYAKNHNLIISEWFEEKETAAKQGRRLFTRMLSALEKGRATGVLLHKVDRGARNLWDWARLQGLLDRGIELHFVHESLDLTSRGGRLSANLQAVIAADYIWNLRDEVLKGVNGRLKQGLYPLPAPIGYLDRGGGKPKEVDPIKGPLIREAFELYATGRYTFETLRPELARLGLRNRGGKQLSRSGLTTILNNPFYIGLIRIKRRGEIYQGIHEPLISKTLFGRVQAILHGRTNVRWLKHDFLFRRMLACAHCGYALVGELQKGHAYYRCHTRGCLTRCVRQEEIDDQLHDALAAFRLSQDEVSALRDEVSMLQATSGESQEKALDARRLSLAALDQRLQRLTDAYIDRLIDKESYTERRTTLLHDRAALTETVKDLTEGTWSPTEECEKFLERLSSLWVTYENGFDYEKREFLKLATSNLTLAGKKLVVELQKPFCFFSDTPELQNGGPHRDGVRTREKRLATKIWDYFVAECERRAKERHGE